jgi:hypothetical protein
MASTVLVDGSANDKETIKKFAQVRSLYADNNGDKNSRQAIGILVIPLCSDDCSLS